MNINIHHEYKLKKKKTFLENNTVGFPTQVELFRTNGKMKKKFFLTNQQNLDSLKVPA